MKSVVIFSISLMVSGCCYNVNSDPPGDFSISGTEQDLNYFRYVSDYYLEGVVHSKNWPDNDCIKDTAAYELAMGPPCDIDFRKYSLIRLYGGVPNMTSASFEVRAFIDHENKKYSVELRGEAKHCSGGSSSNYQFIEYKQLFLIPVVPDNYSFSVEYFYPVINLIKP